MLWQCSIHWPGLSASNSIVIESMGAIAMVSPWSIVVQINDLEGMAVEVYWMPHHGVVRDLHADSLALAHGY